MALCARIITYLWIHFQYQTVFLKEKVFSYKGYVYGLLFDYLTSLGVKTIFGTWWWNMFLVDAADVILNQLFSLWANGGYLPKVVGTNNKIGVALVTTGPGATNSITGIAELARFNSSSHNLWTSKEVWYEYWQKSKTERASRDRYCINGKRNYQNLENYFRS